MLTPQEVSSHAFPKAVMGGYNMTAVDEFLDELTDDYTSLYKENAALKVKLKVLVDKVEDYRATEDGMRATLLAAQKMADAIVHEAEEKRNEMMTQAEEAARAKIGSMQQDVETMQTRIKIGKQEMESFVSAARAVCMKELHDLEQLPTLSVDEATASPQMVREQRTETAAGEIEEHLFASFGPGETLTAETDTAEQQSEVVPEPVQEVAAPEETPEEPQTEPEQSYPEGDPFQGAVDKDSTRRVHLGELKFGRNYSGENPG